jgi:hypothetical protein
MSENQAKAESFRRDILASLERLRGAIRMRVHPRDQAQFLDVVDRIQTQITSESSPENLTSTIQLSRDTTRRVMRQKPADMVQLLNELDGIEEEVMALFQLLTKGPNG